MTAVLTLVLAGCGGQDVERRLATLEQRQERFTSAEEAARAAKQRVSPMVVREAEQTIHRCPEGSYVAGVVVAEPAGRVSLIECRPLQEID